MATPPVDSIINSHVPKHMTLDNQEFCKLPTKTPSAVDDKKVYETVASLEENEFRIFLEEVTSQDRKKADKSAIAQAAQILLRKEEDALKEESGSGEDTQELLSACQKRKRQLKGKAHCDNSSSPSAAARTSTGGSLGSLQDLTETKVPETSSAAGTKSGGSCGNLSRGSFKTQAPLKQRGKRLKVGRASASIREGGSLQNLSKAEAASNEAKKLHKSGSLSQVFTDVGGTRLKNRRQKTSSESSGSRSGRKSEEKDVGSDSECSQIPYRLLVTSPLPAASEVNDTDVVSKLWNRDRMSDVASGESTEEDGENFHSVALSKLSDTTLSHYGNDTELMSVVTHKAHKDNGMNQVPTESEVDKKIKFCLGANSENSLESGRTHISLIPATFFEVSEQENGDKKYKSGKNDNSDNIQGGRRIFDTMTEILPRNRHFNYLQKCSLDAQPIKMSDSNLGITINPLKATYDDSVISHRSNGYSSSGTKEYNYYRMKAKCDKKKILRKKNEIPIEETPGYVGDAPFSEILTFINDKNSSQKGKKKHKNRKEDTKDDKENSKKKKNVPNNIGALSKTTDLSEIKDIDRKKGKGASLRETSSVEDLVSKSKLKEADLFVKKQVAVEDGDVSPYMNKFDTSATASEFSYDFYQVGDAVINEDNIIDESGEFEVVNRKKSRKNRIASNSADKVESSSSRVTENCFDKQKVYSPPAKSGRPPGVRAAMNFSEGVNFDGDVIFNKWPSNKGSNCDRIGHTTSAPHSEGSDSDGDDSVHSMPVKSITQKPEMRHHPQSSDSTPQASYANIAKLSSKKRLAKKRSSDDSSLAELRKSDVNMSDFPPLAENSTPDAIVQDSGGIFSASDLTTSTKFRRNSVSNELLSKQHVVGDDSAPKENSFKPLQNSLKSVCPHLKKSQSGSFQENNLCEGDINISSKIRKECKVNPPKSNNPRPTKSVPSAEPAVIFTDTANMSESVRDIEFGFGIGLEEMLPATRVTDAKRDSIVSNAVPPQTVASQSKKEIRDETSVAELFRRLYVPPKGEFFPNHEELCNLFTTSWEHTLKMLEEDPENIQVWKCPSRCGSPSQLNS